MNVKFLIILILSIIIISISALYYFSQEPSQTNLQSPNESKVKFEMDSLFDIYGFEDYIQNKNGKKIMYNPEFRLNSNNTKIYEGIFHKNNDNAVVIYPIFTASAYSEPGFYSFFREECDQECLTVYINNKFTLDFTTGGNGYQILKLLDYPIISDIDVDKNPDILKQYDKIILLHNEYVTKNEFDAIINHPKVIYLYPNALYAEVKADYDNNSMTLIRGHNFPDSEILNGFDWEYDNSPLEYDVFCKDMKFNEIPNGIMLNCYPENSIHQSRFLLEAIKDF